MKSGASINRSRLWLRRLLGVSLLTFISASAVITQQPATNGGVTKKAASIARARDLLARARQAVGGAAVLGGIQTLSATCKLRRHFKYLSVQSPTKFVDKHEIITGKIELDILLPDRFRRRVKSRDWRGFPYSYTEVVNGAEAWRNPALPARASSSEQRVIDVDDFTRNLERQGQNARHQLAFYALGWLLRELPDWPLEYEYAGEFQIETGKVNSLALQGREGFGALLLLNASSHLPEALVAATVVGARTPVLVEAFSFDRRFMRETYQAARREAQARAKQLRRGELRWRLSDHRPVAGVLLPHQITISIDGEVIEELTVTEIEINQPVNPKKFEDRPKELKP